MKVVSHERENPLKLNIGCGSNKLEGYVNIDCEYSTKPDLLLDILKDKLPYDDSTVDEIVLFHTIEHIQKRYHNGILKELHRVLKPGNFQLYITFPEFTNCYYNWKTNYGGQKEFWEATIYGRQLFQSDYHVCIMDTNEFKEVLTRNGFINIVSAPEQLEPHNTMMCAYKGELPMNYEDLVREDMDRFQLVSRVNKDSKVKK